MFNELEEAEHRCSRIKKELETYYLKTCQFYNDTYPSSVDGVACQTDHSELGLPAIENEKMPDIKLKIALPKRRRGRPMKSQTQSKKRSAVDNRVRGMRTGRNLISSHILLFPPISRISWKELMRRIQRN